MGIDISDSQVYADLRLAQRLERAEGLANAESVESRVRMDMSSGAEWIHVAGAFVLYDGPTSPLTQTFALGLFQATRSDDIEAIEAFYQQRGAPVSHEISPLGDTELVPLLNKRGYRPVEFTSVMYRSIRPIIRDEVLHNERIRVRHLHEDEHELWAQTAAKGVVEFQELADQILDLERVSAKRPNAHTFLGELDGRPIAAGVLCLHDGVALLGGASTIPAARRQGAQRALLDERLHYAGEHGCDIAMLSAQPPGGASQRNGERHGFRIAYTRVKWHRVGAACSGL